MFDESFLEEAFISKNDCLKVERFGLTALSKRKEEDSRSGLE